MGHHFSFGSVDGSPPGARDTITPPRIEPSPGFVIHEIWRGEACGPEVLSAPTSVEFSPEPDVGGAAFRIVTFPPGLEAHLHRTNTTDLVTVLDGEPTLVVDGGHDRRLGVGDTIVQRGAPHGWKNATEHPATIAVVLLSAVSR